MRVAIDARKMTRTESGIGNYTRNLVRALLAGVYGGFMFEDPSTQQSQEVIDVALYYPTNFILLIHIFK